MTREAMIKVLRYKAEHIKTRIKPEFFTEVADALEQQSEDVISRYGVPHKIAEFFSNWDGDENAKMEISVEDMREISSMFVTKCRTESKLKALEQEPQTFEWCTNCREYDQEKHCCHRWSKVIRDTVEEMKQQPCEDDTISREDAYSEVKE